MSDQIIVARFPVIELNRILGLFGKFLDKKFKLAFSGFSVYVPLRNFDGNLKQKIVELGGEIINMDASIFPRKTTPLSLKKLERLYGISFPKSVNLIGDILTINDVPMDEADLFMLGEILRRNFGVRAVFLKVEKISGIMRTAKWKMLAGWGDTFTVHKENGCFFAVDLEKVFFNPRLGNERWRIVKLAGPNEVIIDMFAGVGPFAIQLAKFKNAKVYAIDINRYATELMELNSKLNKVNIRIFQGDAREVIIHERLRGYRIIMNYPERSLDFIDVALSGLGTRGWLHIYVFGYGEGDEKNKIKGLLENLCVEVLRMDMRIVNEVAPRRYLLAFDIFMERKL